MRNLRQLQEQEHSQANSRRTQTIRGETIAKRQKMKLHALDVSAAPEQRFPEASAWKSFSSFLT